MAVTTFAAIDIGSYNVSVEIFELTKKNGLRSLNRVRTGLELGADTFALHKITTKRLNELTKILLDYKEIMKEYGVSGYRACAKSAFREAKNRYLVLDHIYKATGLKVDVLSNSEQRFLGYKSIASRGEEFQKIIEKGTAIVDVGGGSVQISLFDKDALVTTQNIQIGSLRIRERLASFDHETVHYDRLVDQLINKDITNFKRMYLKDRKIDNMVLVGDYFTNLIFQNTSDTNKIETKEEFMQWYDHIIKSSPRDIADELGVSTEMSSVLIPTTVVYRKLIETFDCETIWLPGIQLTDGIAFDYGEKQKIIKSSHDFEKDIILAARNIGKKYAGNKDHNEKLVDTAMAIFNVVKKDSMLDNRAKVLLKVACYLHDCGKYITFVNVAECSYNIIMSTEIIGLSTRERRIIANVVKYNTQELTYYHEIGSDYSLSREDYMLIAQLVAIMRLANCLDQSYLQKIESLQISKKNGELVVTVGTHQDFTLERGIFNENIDFFEEIYNLKPVLKIKRMR
ncbi:MAG: exopolyphosphatase [Lachnospiraceae bacterium]|nr:exopolyphosphatase [Lachnospiraceae bacterium]